MQHKKDLMTGNSWFYFSKNSSWRRWWQYYFQACHTLFVGRGTKTNLEWFLFDHISHFKKKFHKLRFLDAKAPINSFHHYHRTASQRIYKSITLAKANTIVNVVNKMFTFQLFPKDIHIPSLKRIWTDLCICCWYFDFYDMKDWENCVKI